LRWQKTLDELGIVPESVMGYSVGEVRGRVPGPASSLWKDSLRMLAVAGAAD